MTDAQLHAAIREGEYPAYGDPQPTTGPPTEHDFPPGCRCHIRDDPDWGEHYSSPPDGCPVHTPWAFPGYRLGAEQVGLPPPTVELPAHAASTDTVERLQAAGVTVRLVCGTCLGSGHVCENHPDQPWKPATGVGCDCGAGTPCAGCCSPIPEDGHHPATLAFTPDDRRPPCTPGCCPGDRP